MLTFCVGLYLMMNNIFTTEVQARELFEAMGVRNLEDEAGKYFEGTSADSKFWSWRLGHQFARGMQAAVKKSGNLSCRLTLVHLRTLCTLTNGNRKITTRELPRVGKTCPLTLELEID